MVRGHPPPECEKWHNTLQLFNLAIVTSDTTISRKAENVEKTPNLSGAKPKPAAAEKLPRSMTPEGTNTSGCFWWITFRPVEPSRSPVRQCQSDIECQDYVEMTRTIDDHDFLRGLFFGEPIKDSTHSFAKHDAIRIVLTCGADVQVWNSGGFDVRQNVLNLIVLFVGVSATLEIGKCTLYRNHIVGLVLALDIWDTRSHDAF